MSFLFVALVILLLVMLQTRSAARPYISRRPWGIASPQREAVRFFVSLAIALAALYVHDAHSPYIGFCLMLAAWAVTFSWFPGAVRQSRRLSEVPDTLADARAAIAHERVPDLTFLAALITPPGDSIVPAWMTLERNARFFENLPESKVAADGVPALQKFIEAATFDHYWAHPLNDKPGRESITMGNHELRTTFDMHFEDIYDLACQFVEQPAERWDSIASAAMTYGTAAALKFADIPIEYLDTLVERRRYVRSNW